MPSTYNPYSDIQKVFNAKVGWNNATTDEERKRQNEIANAARKNLEAYGYSDVANQISANGANATEVRKIMEQYSPITVAKNNTKSTVEINNLKSNEVNRENAGLFDKYNQEYEDLKKINPFETETGKAILAKYDLAGLQGRDNAIAENAGSNGGNIDSFAAANALRQQSALVNQGQMVALEAHQQKLDHARALLSDMGVNIDRVFNQDETVKNNDVARKSEIAAVSGYTPTEWSIQNDAFLKNFVDETGKLKAEYNDTDFQELINNAKANGNTELANKYAILRGLKIFGNFSEYGKYLNQGDVAYVQPQRTADYDLTKQQLESAERVAKGENDTTLALADKEAASAINQIKTAAEYSTTNNNGKVTKDSFATYQNGVKVGDKNGKPILTKAQAVEMRDSGNTSDQVTYALTYYGESVTPNDGTDLLGDKGDNSKDTAAEDLKQLKSYFTENKIIRFIDEVLKPYIDNSWEINEDVIEKLIVGSTDGTVVENSNSKIYNLDVEDARKICNALGLEASWVDKFTNRTWFHAGEGMKSNN